MLLKNLFLLYQLALFNADAGNGNGGGGATSTGEGGQSGQGGGGTDDAGAGNGTTSGGVTFTQADVDRIAGQTRQQALGRWARDLGFDDPEQIKKIIEAQKEADDKAKSDLEKAQEKAAKADQRATETEQRMYNVLLRSAFDRVAGDQVADLDLAYLAAREAGLLSSEAGIQVDLEKLNVTGIDKAVKKLLEDKPLLKKTSQAKPATTGGGEGGTPAPAQMTEEQKAAYKRRFGVR